MIRMKRGNTSNVIIIINIYYRFWFNKFVTDLSNIKKDIMT